MQTTDRRLTLQIQLNNTHQPSYHNIKKLRLVICMLCMSTFYFGYCLACVSTLSTDIMIDTFGQLTQQSFIKGLVIAILTIGAAIGAFCSPFFMKCLTRRNLILAINIVAIVIEGIIQIPNIICLLVCRGVQGFFIGNFMAIIPILINQICPKQKIGGFGVYTQLFVTFGVLFAYVMGTILSKAGVQGDAIWRVMFALNLVSIITVISGILLNIIPQSPNSLIMKDNIEQAKKVIGMFHKQKFVQKILKEKILQVQHQLSSKRSQNPTKMSSDSLNYSKLAYFLGFQLPFMQQLTGINAIVTQIGSVVSQHNPSFGYYTPLIFNGIQTIATFFAIVAINNLGRRTIILSGNFLLGAFDIILGVLFLFINQSDAIFWVVFVILILYNIVYGVTLGPTVWLYVPEIIPAKIVPFATTLNWIGCSIAILILPVLNQDAGQQAVFFLFGAVSIVTFIINALFLKQTKGKTTQQICNSYSNNSKNS